MKVVKYGIGFLLLGGVLFLLRPIETQRRDLLIFGRGGDSVTLDPAHATDGETFYATVQIYDTLVRFRYGTTEIEPALAESWEISPDGLTYLFRLRKGVFFHRTPYFPEKVELTAKDVVFSLGRQMEWWLVKTYSSLPPLREGEELPGMPQWGKIKKIQWKSERLVFLECSRAKGKLEKGVEGWDLYGENPEPYHRVGGAFQYWLSMGMDEIVRSIEARGKYEVVIRLKRREAPFLANLAMHFTSILCFRYSRKLLKQGMAERLARYPVGTGPFVFRKWIKDDRIIFERNPTYWDGSPRIRYLVLKVIPENSARAAALKAKQIHVMDLPNPAEVEELKKLDYITLHMQEGLNVAYLAMNTRKKPFDNPLVRRAIYHAIHRKAIVEAVFEGLGKVAKNPLPPTIWAYHEKIQDYEYDPEKARELLKKAGYPHGFSTDLWAMPVARPYMPNARKFAEAIQADLAKVGISVRIVTYDWGTYLEKVSRGEHSMAILGWTGDNGDPDNFLYVLLSSQGAKIPASNIAFYQNPEFDRLVVQAKQILDREERKKLYWKAQEIFHRDVPWVPLAHSIVVVPTLSKVKGFRIDPVGSRRFHRVWIENGN